MYGGGNNYLNKPVITGVIASKKINRKGHFFVITGKATFSAAQNLTNELEKYTEVIFAGEPTSENVNFYGDTKTEVLPNSGLNVNLSWLWWQNHDPRDKRKWTAPELAVDMSFDDYKNGRDPVVDYIMQYKEQDPIDKQLANLISNGKQQDALDLAKKYLEDPVHRYYREDTENKINNSGYVLMNQNKLKEANELLGLNVQLFPSSANAYDSYAESWWKLGNIQEAVKNYKIAISKDPGGPTGDNSRAMLKQIEEKKGF
jgi:tetratricopeptide (TPR) repeat protein